MKKPVLVILAAGMGSRYGGLKQMDPMDAHGNLIIDFDIFDARRAGFDEVVFIIKHAIEADFRERIGDRLAKRMGVKYAYQELTMLPEELLALLPGDREKPLGTTHALLCAEDAIGGQPFVIMNADDYYGPAAFSAAYDFLARDQAENEHALVGYRIENTLSDYGAVARGVCEVENGRLTDIVERTKVIKQNGGAAYQREDGEYAPLPAGTTVSMNFWAFNPGIFPALRRIFVNELPAGLHDNPMKYENYLPNAVRGAMRNGEAEVFALDTPDKWFGVTYKEDKPETVAAFAALKAAGIYSERLWED